MILASTISNISNSVNSIGTTAGYKTTVTVPDLVGKIIGILLGILGLLFLVLVVYAGFLYITAQGEEAQVKKAKSILVKAMIGMVLIVSSYAITNVVVDAITTITAAPAATTN